MRHSRCRFGVLIVSLALAAVTVHAGPQRGDPGPVAPDRFAGHRMGEDRKLVKWPRIVEYFELLDRESDRVQVVEMGKTTGGRRMIAAAISSPENLRAANQHRDVAKRLAQARGVDERLARELAGKGRAIVAITLNLHATEIAASQMALELGYHLATDNSNETRQVLDELIVLLVPSLNPDGQVMVCEWYEQGLGTPLEGGRLPWLYQPYAGHDNNRDWFMLNLVETRVTTRFLYRDWPVQALLDQHQMSARGARLFVPPYFDPINPNVHPLIWRQIAVAGSDMALKLEEQGHSGVVSSATYDGWRPGDMDTTPWWHNVVSVITEAASVRVATPILQKKESLVGEQRGLPQYAPQTNFPNPWPGGWWRLRDIVDYEFTAAIGFLQSAARHKTDLLLNSWRMNRDAIEQGSSEAPFAFVVPSEGNDAWTAARLIEPLMLAGVEVHRSMVPFEAGGQRYSAGTYVIPMAQPMRHYAKDLLEAQRYPDRRAYPGGPPEVPYDEAGWTLPLKMGLRVDEIAERFDARLQLVTSLDLPKGRVAGPADAVAIGLPADSNATIIAVNRLLKAGARVTWSDGPVTSGEVTLPAHSYFVETSRGGRDLVTKAIESLPLVAHGVRSLPAGRPFAAPRVGLYQPWGGSADEGWTRWVFELFELPYTTLHDADIRSGSLAERFDTIVVPSIRTRELLTGESAAQGKPTLPAPYAGGLGNDGALQLTEFVRAGGTLVAMDAATDFAIRHLGLPVRNVLAERPAREFFCPGSILRVNVDARSYLTAGLRGTADIFFLGSPAFELQPAAGSEAAAALATYGGSGVLRSGWILGEALLDGRAALVEAASGKGRAVLVGFRAQFRGQTYGTFRVLFNAAYDAAARRAAPGVSQSR